MTRRPIPRYGQKPLPKGTRGTVVSNDERNQSSVVLDHTTDTMFFAKWDDLIELLKGD